MWKYQNRFSQITIARFLAKTIRTNDGCLLWVGTKGIKNYKAKKRYGTFFVPEFGCRMRAHRFSYLLAHRRIRPKHQICHNCPNGDEKGCIEPTHLFSATQKIHSQDTLRKGQYRWHVGDAHWTRKKPQFLARGSRNGTRMHPETVRGENNGHAKVTNLKVRAIRWLRRHGMPISVIARTAGLSESSVYRLTTKKDYRGWKNI